MKSTYVLSYGPREVQPKEVRYETIGQCLTAWREQVARIATTTAAEDYQVTAYKVTSGEYDPFMQCIFGLEI